MDTVDVALVLGFVSDFLKAEISNDFIRDHVNANPRRLIGFAGIDPTRGRCVQEIKRLQEEGFSGLVVSPACQNFHPCDTRAMRIYEVAEALKLPVYFLQADRFPTQARLEYANPVYLDEIARSFSQLRMVISNVGFPYSETTIALLAKQEHIYATVAGLSNKAWQLYRVLTLAYEYGVMDRLLFGSGFPVQDCKSAVESLYHLNNLARDSVLPVVPREHIRGIIERDSLKLLGLKRPG